MIKKFNNFINESVDDNTNLLNFYNEYKKLFDDETDSDVIYDMIGDLTIDYNLTREDVNTILTTMDVSFDVDRLLKETYNNWIEDGMTRGSGHNEEPESMRDKIYQSLYNLTKDKYDDKLGEWLDDLSVASIEELFNILVSSGQIEDSL